MAPPRQIRRGDGYITERTTAAGETRYQCRWHDGERWRAKTFADPDDAEDHLRAIGRRKRRGTYTAETALTVAELVDAYLERGRQRWSTNTVATYRLLARRQIGPNLGSIRATELTPARVQRWIDTLAADGLSAAVIENARTVLGGACREAVRLGALPTDPVAGTRVPARKRTKKITWSAAEVGRVLAATKGDVWLHAYYATALTTAMRPGELRALRWGDIDLEAGVATVQRTMTRGEDYRHRIGETTKTGRTRTVALPPETVAALRAHRRDQAARRLAAPAWHDVGTVFDRGDGNPVAQQTMSTRHRLTCDRAGVPRIRMHDLRHTSATLLMERGIHPKIVADLLGHSSVTITLDTYSHVSADMHRAASESLRSVFGSEDEDAVNE